MNHLPKIILSLSIIISNASYAQISRGEIAGSEPNTITTAVPFLTIAMTTESARLGDISVVNPLRKRSGIFGNPSLLVQDTSRLSISTSYTPWLRELIPDILQNPD